MDTHPSPVDRLLLRVGEVADVLGVSRSKAYQLIAAGILPSIRVGSSLRVPVDGLRVWIERQTAAAATARGAA